MINLPERTNVPSSVMTPPVARPALQPVGCGAPGPVLLRHPGRDRGGRGGGVRHVSAGRLYPGTRVSSACPGVSPDCADVLPAGPGVRRGPVLGAARLQLGGRGDHGTAVYCTVQYGTAVY